MSTTLLPPTEDDVQDESGLYWREPAGLGAYLVSLNGDIRSFNDSRYPDGHLVDAPSGRTLVRTEDGRRVSKTIAQIVMMAWHSPAPPNCSAGHLNGDKSDNRPANLFWETRSQQNLRANRVKRATCPRGHLYEGDNLFVNREGCSCCRICYRASWWASKFRRLARTNPLMRPPVPAITVEVVLELSADARFPSGAPDISTVLVTAARHHHRMALEASRLVGEASPAA